MKHTHPSRAVAVVTSPSCAPCPLQNQLPQNALPQNQPPQNQLPQNQLLQNQLPQNEQQRRVGMQLGAPFRLCRRLQRQCPRVSPGSSRTSMRHAEETSRVRSKGYVPRGAGSGRLTCNPARAIGSPSAQSDTASRYGRASLPLACDILMCLATHSRPSAAFTLCLTSRAVHDANGMPDTRHTFLLSLTRRVVMVPYTARRTSGSCRW